MAKIIEARAILSVDDRLSPALRRSGDELRRLASVGERLNGMTQAMGRAEQAARRLGDATRAAAEARSMANAVRAIDSAGRAYERAATAARDLRNAGNQAVRVRVDDAALKAYEARLKQVIELQAKLGRGGASAAPGARVPPAHFTPQGQAPRGPLGVPGSPALTPGNQRGYAREGFDQAASLPQVESQMKMRGESEENIRKAREQAVELARSVPQFSIAQHMQGIYQSLSIFGDMQKALSSYPQMARANALIEGLQDRFTTLKPYTGGTMTKDFARIFDSMGVTEDPKRQSELAEAIIRGITASAGDVTPSDYLMAIKYMRIGRYGYNLDFLGNYLPGIIGDSKVRGGGVMSAGTGLAALSDQLANLRATPQAKEEMIRLGMINGEFERNASGRIVGKGTANVVNVDQLRQNPQRWAVDTLLPIIERRIGKLTGDDEQDARNISDVLGNILSNRVAADMLGSMILQRGERERDARIARGMPGMAALDVLNKEAPMTALQNLTAASKDFLGTLAGPFVPGAVAGMNSLSDAIRRFTTWAHDNPQEGAAASAAIGAGGVAATAAAAAAARNWWKGPTPPGGPTPPMKLPPGANPTAHFMGGGATAAASRVPFFTRLGTAGLAIGAGFALNEFIGEANRKLYQGQDPTQPHNQGRSRRRAYHEALRAQTEGVRREHDEPREGVSSLPSFVRFSRERPEPAGREGQQGSSLQDLTPLRDLLGKPLDVTGKVTAEVSGSIPVDVTGKVESELKGHADVNVTVRVQGPGQVSNTSSVSSGHVRSNVGTSMSDVGAP